VTLLLLAAVARADVEFSGYATVGRQVRFVLTDTASKHTSNWILLGEEFLGHTLIGFNAQADTLSVRKGSIRLELPLKPSRVMPRNLVVIDSVAMLDASKIPEMRAEVLGSGRIPIADSDRIGLIVEVNAPRSSASAEATVHRGASRTFCGRRIFGCIRQAPVEST
jgi:hypothetical protein